MIYRVHHFDPHFTGYYGAVDFHDGHGSTSSATDVVRLVQAGCRLPDPAARAEIRVLAQRLGRERRKRAEERAAQAAYERTPEYTAKALERMAEAERNDPATKHRKLLERRMRRLGAPIKKIKR